MKLAKYKRYLRIAQSNEYWTFVRAVARVDPSLLGYYLRSHDDGLMAGIDGTAYADHADTVAARSENNAALFRISV
jgi:hypothetical protein